MDHTQLDPRPQA